MAEKRSVPIDVFILHWNRPQECLETVGAFLRQDVAVNIVVLDNGSRPEAIAALCAGLVGKADLIRFPSNLGWGAAFNRALLRWLKTAGPERDICALSAHDARPDPDCLRLLAEALRGDRAAGIASPQYDHNSVPLFSPLAGPREVPRAPKTKGTAECVSFANGTLSLIKRDCLEAIGLFDERYFAYGDEFDLSLRARRRDWKVLFVWGARVINPGTWTASEVVTYLYARNTLLLAREHGGAGAALARLCLMLANSLRLALTGKINRVILCARLRGIKDFLANHFPHPIRSTRCG